MGSKVCIHLVRDKVQWRTLLDMVINQRVLYISGISWPASCVCFLRTFDQSKATFFSFYFFYFWLVIDF